MKFRLRESIDLSPFYNSNKAKDALARHSSFSDKAISQLRDRDDIKKATKLLGKASKEGDTILQYLYADREGKNRGKIEKNRDIFASELVNSKDGELPPRFQFLASLPDAAYNDKARLKYLISKMDNGSLPVPNPDNLPKESDTVNGSITPTKDFFISPGDIHSLYYVDDLWKTSEDFEKILDIYCVLNKKDSASKFLDADAVKRITDNPVALRNIFLEKDTITGEGNAAARIDRMKNIRQNAVGLAGQEDTSTESGQQSEEPPQEDLFSISELADREGYMPPEEFTLMRECIKDFYDSVELDRQAGRKHDMDDVYIRALRDLNRSYQMYESSDNKDALGKRTKEKHDIFQKMITDKRFTEKDRVSVAKFTMEAINDLLRRSVLRLRKKRPPTSGDRTEQTGTASA